VSAAFRPVTRVSEAICGVNSREKDRMSLRSFGLRLLATGYYGTSGVYGGVFDSGR
jgi:hypothetical protein